MSRKILQHNSAAAFGCEWHVMCKKATSVKERGGCEAVDLSIAQQERRILYPLLAL